ncbi:hypothetical protein NVP2095A_14 [Vibrio phage 2.095.A._10N.286.46.E10]|nr:hypothetical protein NVP2095A_14 [Vibrio phage 2.095.A._10N.286.46.E10]AUS02172.1 hypothetical protein NVP2095B_14 [Vibrio phage 2.095.B._10N.286.46.E10]
MIEWKSIKEHKPTDFVRVEEWTYEVDVIVFPKVEGSDDTRDAAYRVKTGEFIMTNSDGYDSYDNDVTEFITHFAILNTPKED